MNSGYFVIYASGRQWRWHLVASNGRIIATTGEAYHNYSDCEGSINVVKTAGRENWNVYEAPQGPFAKAFYIYPDASSQYRWALYASNGLSVAVSSEAYVGRQHARDSVTITKSAWSWPVLKKAA